MLLKKSVVDNSILSPTGGAGTLSLCMIVKNEGILLARCLASVSRVVDQIVVVDTGSQDTTIAVARSFNALVVEDAWRNDFSWSRNISLDHATGEWVLWLDADDVVPQSSLPMIASLKKQTADRVYGFIVRNERPGSTGTEFVQARMFPNRKDIRFERRVHEQMMISALKAGLVMEKKEVVIEHHGYADPVTLKSKAARNIALMLQEFNPEKPDQVTAVEIADSYLLMDACAEAKKWYTTVLAIPGCLTATPAIASQAHLGLGNICNKENQFKSALPHLLESINLAPWRTDAQYSLAVSYELCGQLDNAVATLRGIVAAKPSPGQVGVDFRAAAIKSWLRLLRILTEQKRGDEAIAGARQAVLQFPDRGEIALMAGKVELAHKNLMEALKLFEKSNVLSAPGNIDAFIGLCTIYKQADRSEVARKTILAIEALFGRNLRYWAFRREMLDERTMPAGFSEYELENEWILVKRDFFHVQPHAAI